MWRDKSAMVVEDDEAIRSVLAQALDFEMGAYTVVAPDGEEAVRWADRLTPTIVILDLMLPGLNGVEVARRLRANPRTAASRIIAISALTPSAAARQRALAAGCDAFLAKPFRIDDLLDIVHRYLRETDPGREANSRERS
jgi:DNA-binding response OmpR family regulator